MSLETQLAGIRAGAAKRIPEDIWALMGRATEDLRNSGIMDTVIKVGDPLPAFTLANTKGVEIRSQNLLDKGPLVLTVYRGHW